jgi:hypothetical protein
MAETNPSNDQAGAAKESPAFQSARDWYSEFLGRELANRGQADAALYLDHYLRLVPNEEESTPDGGAQLKADLTQRLTEYSVRLNARSGDVVSWYVDFLARDGDTSADPKELFEIARAVAKPPPDAKLVVAGYDTSSGRPMFRVRWRHVVNGLPVEGDYLEALVNGKHKRVFSVSRVWRTPQLEGLPCEK